MKKYNEFINEAELTFPDINNDSNKDGEPDLNLFKINPYEEKDLKELSLIEIGKQGKLAEYIDQGNEVKFGMLKALYHDAIEYKRKREYQKGVAKFALRIIPLAMAPIFFPIWLISQILGATRAFNKIILPTFYLQPSTYDSFLRNLITKTMNLAEGDIRPFLGKDWYYDIFYVHDGLTKMVKEKYIYEFALYISQEIEKKKDDEVVPHYWLDNEFRKWLNNKFEIDLPTGKIMIRHKIKD
jgi:hypothetical protein